MTFAEKIVQIIKQGEFEKFKQFMNISNMRTIEGDHIIDIFAYSVRYKKYFEYLMGQNGLIQKLKKEDFGKVILAASKGYSYAMQMLKDSDCINQVNKKYIKESFKAASNCYPESLDKLKEFGFVERLDTQDITEIVSIASQKSTECFKEIAKDNTFFNKLSGANKGQILLAAASCNVESLKFILEDKEFKVSLMVRDYKWLIANAARHKECLSYLLDNHYEDTLTLDSVNAAILLASGGHAECLELLLENDHVRSKLDAKGKSQAIMNASAGHPECLELLYKHNFFEGLDANTIKNAIVSAFGSKDECIKFFGEKGYLKDASPEIIKQLLDNKINVGKKTFIEIAKNKELIKSLDDNEIETLIKFIPKEYKLVRKISKAHDAKCIKYNAGEETYNLELGHKYVSIIPECNSENKFLTKLLGMVELPTEDFANNHEEL